MLLATTSLDADWTTLPLTSFYLPFVQSAVRYLADTSPRKTNLLPGEPIEVSFDDPAPGRKVRVTPPDGQDRPADLLRPGELTVARYTDTEQPGQYQVRVTDPGKKPYTLHYVVRPPRDESDLTPMTDDRWKWMERVMGAERIDPAERPLSASAAAASGTVELWVWLLGGVLFLAVLEMLLARRWSRDPAAGDGSEPAGAE